MSFVVRGASLPPERNDRWFPVVGPKGPQPLRVVLLDDLLGVYVHYEGRSLPCYMTHDCPYCERGMPQKWYGYVACYATHPYGAYLKSAGRAVLAVSTGAARQLKAMYDEYGTLRGLCVEIAKRFAHKVNSTYVVKKLGRGHDGDVCPAHEIQPSLSRMWGINENFWRNQRQADDSVKLNNWNEGVPLPADNDRPEPVKERPANAEEFRRLRDVLGDAFRME